MYLPPAIHHFPNTLDLSVTPKVSGSLLGTTLLGELFAELFGDEDEENAPGRVVVGPPWEPGGNEEDEDGDLHSHVINAHYFIYLFLGFGGNIIILF